MKLVCGVTTLLCLLGVAVSDGGRETYITLALDWAMNWGEWGPMAFCPQGTFTYAFELKVESEDSNDDTSINGVRLYCRSMGDVGREGVPPKRDAKEFTITSTVEEWGDWRGNRECPLGLLTGMRMKSEEDQGMFVDDTAANDLEMQCDHTTTTINGGGNTWGYYSSWVSCPPGWAICGLETRVESSTASDDTALNDVRMFCCDATEAFAALPLTN